jgi:hypothetical protein
MNIDMSTVRLLGAAQLAVFLASMVSERLLASVVENGDISASLVNISNSLGRIRTSNLVALMNCAAIVVLGVLFYIVFRDPHPIMALIALGFYLAEAITLAVSKIGVYALIPFSQEFVVAGAPESSFYRVMGDFFYHGVYRVGYDIHMLFFCLGGIVWYYLLHGSRGIPPWLSLWGLVGISLLTIPVLFALFKRDSTAVMVLGLPYAPFELALGLWLVARGLISA